MASGAGAADEIPAEVGPPITVREILPALRNEAAHRVVSLRMASADGERTDGCLGIAYNEHCVLFPKRALLGGTVSIKVTSSGADAEGADAVSQYGVALHEFDTPRDESGALHYPGAEALADMAVVRVARGIEEGSLDSRGLMLRRGCAEYVDTKSGLIETLRQCFVFTDGELIPVTAMTRGELGDLYPERGRIGHYGDLQLVVARDTGFGAVGLDYERLVLGTPLFSVRRDSGRLELHGMYTHTSRGLHRFQPLHVPGFKPWISEIARDSLSVSATTTRSITDAEDSGLSLPKPPAKAKKPTKRAKRKKVVRKLPGYLASTAASRAKGLYPW